MRRARSQRPPSAATARALPWYARTTPALRAGIAALAGAAVLALPWHGNLAVRGLAAWICAGVSDLALTWFVARGTPVVVLRERASAQDESAPALFLAMLAAVGFAVAAIVSLLLRPHAAGMAGAAGAVGAADAGQGGEGARVALAMAALAISWFWIHVLFAFRYAHLYYWHEARLGAGRSPAARAAAAGLDFPGDEAPDYLDFLYHALVIGMTSQVSDVQVTTRAMRRVTTVQSLLSFAFNMVLLAMGINLAAGAMN